MSFRFLSVTLLTHLSAGVVNSQTAELDGKGRMDLLFMF